MPKVRNTKKAKDFCEGEGRRRGRTLSSSCSFFVLVLLFSMGMRLSVETGWVGSRLSRASVTVAKVHDPTGASSTLGCHFRQA